ncbi:MAG TPA: CTP synthase [Isosphaeraceae bacterium]|nr:CTP synthase [Isosphaeraceae bacterium]
MAKHIFVTGGVVSSLGKGLTCASIGLLLEKRGLRVSLQKFDPYINVDPGTMSPYQHGEVYVLDDGSETDLDLGHYERFTHATLTKDCNYTTGKIYLSVIQKEREGSYYEGKTVQVIPHVTDEIKAAIHRLATDDVDVVITEIGGTVGDIEGQPFLEAIRQFALDVGRENCVYIHLTLVPYLKAAAELKTKPTQHSVGALRQIGIQPDVLICRTEHPISADDKDKIALFCNVERKAVIEEQDKKVSIYEVPLSLVDHGLDQILVERLRLPARPLDLSEWKAMVERITRPKHNVRIAVAGKYMKHRDAYKSVYESLDHAGVANRAKVEVVRVEAEEVDSRGAEELLRDVDGILVPGGFGMRGIDGKIEAIRYARTRGIPFFGICLGLQCAVVEFARSILGHEDANSTEFDRTTEHPVIWMMEEQQSVRERGGTMRLGAWPCVLAPRSLAIQAYGAPTIRERHRHRYEINNAYRNAFREHGFVASGTSPDGTIVEIMELTGHPWFLAVQFHPEFKSKPTAAHPLFREFVAAALRNRSASRPESEARPFPQPNETVKTPV